MIGTPAELRIGTLRVKGHGEMSNLAARAERAFLTADLQPRSLPKSSILFIKRLHMNLADGWQSLAREAIDETARHAVRPALGFVPANCDAVLFSDLSELLACIARDLCDGTIAAKWWWIQLLKGDDALLAVPRTWHQYREHIPAALEHLAAIAYAIPFVTRIPDRVAEAITAEVRTVFGLEDIRQHRSDREQTPLIAGRELPRHEIAQRMLVPEGTPPQLTAAQHMLLATSLLLRRAPHEARLAELQRVRAELNTSTSAETEQEHQPDRPTKTGPEWAAASEERSVAIDGPSSPRYEHAYQKPKMLAPEDAPLEPLVSSPVLQQAEEAAVPSRRRVIAPSDLDDKEENTMRAAPPMTESFAAADESRIDLINIHSNFAGCFHVVNVGIALGLYADFTSLIETGIALALWDFIAIVGREMVGPSLEQDALWNLLAQLAGRDEREQPGTWFEPAADWQVPREWLRPFPERDAWRYSRSGGRVTLIHPRGFPVVDAADQDLDPETLSEMYKFNSESLEPAAAADDYTSLERWRHHLMQYLRARLGSIATDLCPRHGRIELTATHLDVIFPLEQISIEIRVAGLDRNPGWVPAAGRFIRFHYE